MISYFYYLRVVVVMYMRPAPAEDHYRAGLPAAPRGRRGLRGGRRRAGALLRPAPVLDAAQRSVAALFAHAASAFFGMHP